MVNTIQQENLICVYININKVHGEFTHILVPLGDGLRKVNKNMLLFLSLLIRNWPLLE
jgi:hypothetical protein